MSFTDAVIDYQRGALQEVVGMPIPKGIAFEGGGILGICYTGVLKKLEELQIYDKIKFIAGSSAGSLIGGLVACKIPISKLEEILLNFDFNSLNNSNWLFLNNAYRLINHYGWSNGDNIKEAYGKILKEYVGDSEITLGQIYEKFGRGLIITATSWKKKETIYYAFDTHPQMKLKDAVRRSGSFPINFSPEFVTENNTKDLLIDGGMLDNYPIRALYKYCSPEEVIGAKLVSSNDPEKCPHFGKDPIVTEEKSVAPSLESYLIGLVNIYQTFALKMHVKIEDWERSVKINIGNVGVLDFKISLEMKKWLIDQGYQATDNYFDEII